LPLKEIWPGPGFSEIELMTASEDLIFFRADDGINGKEPWVSDGTPEGTALLKDIRPGPDSFTPGDFTVHGNHVFFHDDGGMGQADGLANERLKK